MRYLEMKAQKGAPENKALSGPPENKEAEDVASDDPLANVLFASPSAKAKAEEAGLTAAAFHRKKKSSDKGFTLADVERIAAL